MARKLDPHKGTKSVNPFRTRKTRKETQPAVSDTITPPYNIAVAIDALREAQDQARFFEGESTVHKNEVLTFSEEQYGKRLSTGNNDSFKILGEESIVTYVVVDSSAGLTEEDVDEFRSTFGTEAADELITRDLGSLRFDSKILEENYDSVVAAHQVLPKDVLGSLFKPMLLRAKPGAAEAARKFVKSPEDLVEILKALKMKNFSARKSIDRILHAGWVGQAKINGHRAQIHIHASPDRAPMIYNRQGKPHSVRLPEAMVEELRRILPLVHGWTVVDAEWIKPRKKLYLFDMIKLNGELLKGLPYEERYALLPRDYLSPFIQTLPLLRTLDRCLRVLKSSDPVIEGLVFKSANARGFADTSIVRCRKAKVRSEFS